MRLALVKGGEECIDALVDPHFSTTASKARKWIPIKPGTDAAMYLGMVSHILDNKLYDEEFVLAHTSMPYLLKKDGTLLRWQEVSGEKPRKVEDEKTGEVKDFDPFVVWDTRSKSLQPYDGGRVKPALEVADVKDAAAYKTVFTSIKENQEPYTIDWASEKTGIPAEDLIYIAERYATSGASMLGLGMGGADKYANADVLGHAVGIMVALTDQVYATESGRLDVYYENMLKWNQALPTWDEPIEVYEDNPAREQFPFQLTQTRSRFFIHSMFYDAKWINQFFDSFVEMNPADMASAGVADRDTIEVYNDRGSFTCQVFANESVHPGSLRTTEGAWSRNMGAGHIQSVTNDQMRERRVDLMKGGVTPFNDTLVAIRKAK